MVRRQRHDRLIRRMAEDPALADRLARKVVPKQVAAMLSDEPVTLVSGQFVGGGLRESRTDLLLRARLKGLDGGEIFILIEHKSFVDRDTPMQILRYKLEIWARELREGRRPTPICAVVVYHGAARWTAPHAVYGMMDVPESVVRTVHGADPDAMMGYHLHHIAWGRAGGLPREPRLRAVFLALLLDQVEGMPGDVAGEVMADFTEALRRSGGHLIVDAVLHYVSFRKETPFMARLMEAVSGGDRLWLEGKMATIAQEWLNEGEAKGRVEGEAKGRVEGEAKGRADMLLGLLERRFGEVPDGVVAQVRAAGAEDIDRWADAAFDARGITDIFRNGVAH